MKNKKKNTISCDLENARGIRLSQGLLQTHENMNLEKKTPFFYFGIGLLGVVTIYNFFNDYPTHEEGGDSGGGCCCFCFLFLRYNERNALEKGAQSHFRLK